MDINFLNTRTKDPIVPEQIHLQYGNYGDKYGSMTVSWLYGNGAEDGEPNSGIIYRKAGFTEDWVTLLTG